MGIFKDLTGQRFDRLLVLGIDHVISSPRTEYYYKCQCDCGTIKIILGASLKRGRTKSCGCLRNEVTISRNTKHNSTRSREYRSWQGAKTRCYTKENPKYPSYGGRGITMCDEWLNDFPRFLADMGKCPPNCSIDRIDNNKGYSPDNCRWATPKQQANNQRSTALVSYQDKIKPVSEWATELGFSHKTLYARLFIYEWPIEKAFTKPQKARRTKQTII